MAVDAGDDAAIARAHLVALASAPRPAGGTEELRARAYCAERLRALGFEVSEEPFAYSTLPGRWATPAIGVLALLVLLAAGQLGAQGAARASLVLLAAGAAAIAAASVWLAWRGVLELPLARAYGVNLEARPTRHGRTVAPAVWLMAHLDSKSQPVPMLLRAAGITVAGASWVALAALAVFSLSRDAEPAALVGAWRAVTVVGALALLPVMATLVGDASPGALDDASGVASVLLAAERLGSAAGVGVLLTSAEELGLAGARAWVATRNPTERVPVLNCDGVDDGGELVLMHTGRRPERLLTLAAAVGASGGPRAGARRLIPGVLVDAVAFADAGWETLTVSRGTLRTLQRVHRPSDDLAHLRGDGVPSAAALLARLAERVVEQQGRANAGG